MNSLHEYESWLDTLDQKLFLRNGAIISEFAHGLTVPLRSCCSKEEIVRWSVQFARTLDEHRSSSVNLEYLVERFVRLAITGNKLHYDKDELARRANEAVAARKTIWLPPGV